MKFSIFKGKESSPFVVLDISHDGGEKNEFYYIRLLASALRNDLKSDIRYINEYGDTGGVEKIGVKE